MISMLIVSACGDNQRKTETPNDIKRYLPSQSPGSRDIEMIKKNSQIFKIRLGKVYIIFLL